MDGKAGLERILPGDRDSKGDIPRPARHARSHHPGRRIFFVDVATGEILAEHEILRFRDESALVGIGGVIDFCLARLIKCHAGQHFECRGSEAGILVRKVLFTQIRCQCPIVDLRSEKRNHTPLIMWS